MTSVTEKFINKDFEVQLPADFIKQMSEQKIINIYAPPHQGKNLGAILIAKAIGGSIMGLVDETYTVEEADKKIWSHEPATYDNVLVEAAFFEYSSVLDDIKPSCRLFILHSIAREEMMDDVNVGQIRMSIDGNVFFKWRNRETGKLEVIEYDVRLIPSLNGE